MDLAKLHPESWTFLVFNALFRFVINYAVSSFPNGDEQDNHLIVGLQRLII